MTQPSRQDVHLGSGARDLTGEAAYLSSISIINVPGPSPGGSIGGSGAQLGPRGYTGDAGASFLGGASLPPNEVGNIGDFWLDTRPDQYVVYRKVSQSVWPSTGYRIKGPPGADGLRGGQTFFIQGQPTDANASAFEGDTAFATDTFLYYRRGPDGWPANGTLLQGPMGINGVDGYFGAGSGAPTDAMGQGSNGIYFQSTGEIWTRQVGAPWVDTGQNNTGPRGLPGADGLRGTLTYHGIGAPPDDLSLLNPPAQANDVWYDIDPNNVQRPILYFLN